MNSDSDLASGLIELLRSLRAGTFEAGDKVPASIKREFSDTREPAAGRLSTKEPIALRL